MMLLPRGRLLRLPAAAGTTCTAHSGMVWITEPANPRDVIIGPGESFRATQPGLLLLEALSDARISFES